MRLTLSEEQMIEQIVENERASVQAAAYLLYTELIKGKPMSAKEFHVKFVENWEVFMGIEQREIEERR